MVFGSPISTPVTPNPQGHRPMRPWLDDTTGESPEDVYNQSRSSTDSPGLYEPSQSRTRANISDLQTTMNHYSGTARSPGFELQDTGASSFNSSQRTREYASLYHDAPTGIDGPRMIIPLHTVKALSADFNLPLVQSKLLENFVVLASSDEQPLTKTDLLCRIFHLAIDLKQAADAEKQREHEKGEAKTFRGLLEDFKAIVEDSFRLSKENIANIRAVAKETFYQPTRVTFKSMHLDVLETLRKEKEPMNMGRIFGNPSREQVLVTAIRRVISSVKNSAREDYRDHLFGNPKKKARGKALGIVPVTDLVDFTSNMGERYRRIGKKPDSENPSLVRNALIRAFAFDNQALLNIETPEEPAGENFVAITDEDVEDANKRSKKGGRVAEGEDFWSKVEEWFAKQIEARKSSNLTGKTWKPFVDAVLDFDLKHRFRGQRMWNARASEEPTFVSADSASQPGAPPLMVNRTNEPFTHQRYTALQTSSQSPQFQSSVGSPMSFMSTFHNT